MHSKPVSGQIGRIGGAVATTTAGGCLLPSPPVATSIVVAIVGSVTVFLQAY